jgi:hypothetical protein
MTQSTEVKQLTAELKDVLTGILHSAQAIPLR